MIRIGRVSNWLPFVGVTGGYQNYPCELTFLCTRPAILSISDGVSVLEVPLPVGKETVEVTMSLKTVITAEAVDGQPGGVMVYNSEPELLQARDLPSMVEFAEHRMGALLTQEQIDERRRRRAMAEAGKKAASLQAEIGELRGQMATLLEQMARATLSPPKVESGGESGGSPDV